MRNVKSVCEFCQGEMAMPFLVAKDRLAPNNSYAYFQCNSCGLISLSKKSGNENFQAYNLSLPTKAQKIVLYHFYLKIRKIKERGEILDFGCGAGNLSKFLSEKGYLVDSFEIDKKYIDWLKKVQGITALKRISGKKYDVIILKDVLEHLEQPIKTLQELKGHLKEEGVMFISLQNIDSHQARVFKSKWFHLDAPRHIYQFPRKTLRKIFAKNGLKIVKEYFFNFDIDPTGWYWSIKRSSKMGLREKLVLCFFLPLVGITSLLKTTGEVTYILKNETINKYCNSFL